MSSTNLGSILIFAQDALLVLVICTRDPLRGRLTPPATLAQGKIECNKNHVKGTERRSPMIWCKQRFDNANNCLCRASCPAVLSCAVCFCYRCYVLIGSTGVICVGEKTGPRERSNTCRNRKKKSSTSQHVLYCSMFERKHRAQHDTAPQRRARQRTVRLRTALHGATLRCWAIYSRTGLSWACIVIQQRST